MDVSSGISDSTACTRLRFGFPFAACRVGFPRSRQTDRVKSRLQRNAADYRDESTQSYVRKGKTGAILSRDCPSRLITCRRTLPRFFIVRLSSRDIHERHPPSDNGITDNRYRRNGTAQRRRRRGRGHVEEIIYEKTDIPRINSARTLSMLQEQNYAHGLRGGGFNSELIAS